MRIGIDARFYGSIGKGLGRYTSELLAHLEQIDSQNDYVVFLRASNFDSYVPRNPRFTKALAEFPWYSWREQLLYPRLLAAHGLDLMHFLHFNVPFFYRRPFVVTVHDLILLSHPTTRATTLGPLKFWAKYALYRAVIGRAVAASHAVITVSETAKREILRHFPAASRKPLTVTYEAVAPSVRVPGAPLRADISKPFLFYVGNAYPHKNLEALVQAFALFRQTHPDWRLVLVGSKEYFYERLERETRERGLAENVTFFGHATDEELSGLYDNASFYAFPSLCEGFGLPPLEAMQHGLPVASSNASCMPEILGDAAQYFDPTTPESIAAGLRAIADDPALREALVARGRERVKRYDWKRCAERTLEVYTHALTHDVASRTQK